MKMYKVMFENNMAVSAMEVDISNKVRVEVERRGNKKIVKWAIVFASSKEESMNTATGIAGFAI